MAFQKYPIQFHGGDRGSLAVVDGILPFDIKRVFWIWGSDGLLRGGHRHHKTVQALVAINGVVEVFMNDGKESQTIHLTSPSEYLLVQPKDWHTMKFEEKSILLVLSSHSYDPLDYIDTPYEK